MLFFNVLGLFFYYFQPLIALVILLDGIEVISLCLNRIRTYLDLKSHIHSNFFDEVIFFYLMYI